MKNRNSLLPCVLATALAFATQTGCSHLPKRSALHAPTVPSVIFDTDIGSDCDDAGAMATLHALADAGELRILGVIYSSGRIKYGVGVCDAINTYYGRGNLPLGQYKGNDVGDPTDSYSSAIATNTPRFSHDVVDDAPELVSVYRKLLASQPDRSVTILTVGHPHGLVHLMRDPRGMELVRQKVARWVAMGLGGWNFLQCGMSAYSAELLEKWTLPFFISPAGADIITGHRLLPKTPENNPVREAYRLWRTALVDGRSSWDQVATLFVVRPELFNVEDHGRIERTPEGPIAWNPKVDRPNHHLVTPKISNAEMADLIKELMARPPKARAASGRDSSRVNDAGDARAKDYLQHRQAVLRLLDNADAFVVVDGDPGGYVGAPVEEYLRVLKNDQQAVPGQRVIPWLWNGWGRDTTDGYWRTPVALTVRASLEALKQQMTGDWELLPGRSHREGWANGRVPVAETERAGLLPRSTILCYEAIEFEPTPPAAGLQFDLIRQVLKQESQLSAAARGVFGNAQTPVLVLPNLYFFGRGAADLGYLEKPDQAVLADFARELGDDSWTLVTAWSCLKLPLPELPSNLAGKVRALRLTTDLAKNIPGGPGRYVEILAAQVDSRRSLLEAVAEKPGNAEAAAASLAKGAAALLRWWQVHRYVGTGRHGDPFKWDFIHPSQIEILKQHVKKCATANPDVVKLAAPKLAETGLLAQDEALKRWEELIR